MTRDDLAPLLFYAFRLGVALGKDWRHHPRDVDESDRDVEANLFAEHLPGFESGADRARLREAGATLRQMGETA